MGLSQMMTSATPAMYEALGDPASVIDTDSEEHDILVIDEVIETDAGLATAYSTSSDLPITTDWVFVRDGVQYAIHDAGEIVDGERTFIVGGKIA